MPITKARSIELERLVDKMLSLKQQLIEMEDRRTDKTIHIEDEIRRTDKEIDEKIYKLYGITEREKKIIEDDLALNV